MIEQLFNIRKRVDSQDNMDCEGVCYVSVPQKLLEIFFTLMKWFFVFQKVKVNLPRKFKVKSFHQLALKIFYIDF